MRHIAEFSTLTEAQALSDYLEVNDIEVILRGEELHEVWVVEDDELDKAQSLADAFDGADHGAEAEKRRRQRERDAKPMVSGAVRGQGSSRGAPAGPLTVVMIVASVLVALGSSFGDTIAAGKLANLLVTEVIIDAAGDAWIRTELVWSQPWRLVTPMFIHFGFIHLLFNMMWLYRLGSQIEERHGTIILVLVAVAAQVPGSLAQFQASGPMFGGMSGVVFALFGFVWTQARYGRESYRIDRSETVMMLGWLLLCATGWVGPIANACHAIGLAVGLLAGLPAYIHFARSTKMRRPFEKGSWEDLHVHGFQRFTRLYLEPFAPFWFLAIAVFVLLLDF